MSACHNNNKLKKRVERRMKFRRFSEKAKYSVRRFSGILLGVVSGWLCVFLSHCSTSPAAYLTAEYYLPDCSLFVSLQCIISQTSACLIALYHLKHCSLQYMWITAVYSLTAACLTAGTHSLCSGVQCAEALGVYWDVRHGGAGHPTLQHLEVNTWRG